MSGREVAEVAICPEEKSLAAPMEWHMVSTFLKMMRASTRSVVKNFESVGHALDTRDRSRSVEVLAEMKGAVAELQQVLWNLEERLDQPGGSSRATTGAPGVDHGVPVHCEDMWISMLGRATDHQRRAVAAPDHEESKATAEASKLRRQVQGLEQENEDLRSRCKALLQRLEASETLSLRDQRENLAASRERFEKEAAEEKEKLQKAQDKLRRRERALKDMLKKAIEEVREMRPSPSAGNQSVSQHSDSLSSVGASAARGGTMSASMQDCSWLVEAHQGVIDALTPTSGASSALPQHDVCASGACSPKASELSFVSSVSTPRVLDTEEALRHSKDRQREQEEEEEEEGWSMTPLSSSSPIEAAVPVSALHSHGSKTAPPVFPAAAAAEASFTLPPLAVQGALDQGFHPRRSMSPALPTTGSPMKGLGSDFLFSIPTTVSAELQHSTDSRRSVDRTIEDVSACCIGSVADMDVTSNSLSVDSGAAVGVAASFPSASASARPTNFAFWVPSPQKPSKSTHSQAPQTSSTSEKDPFQRVMPRKGRSKARHVALPPVDLQEPPRTPTDVRALKRDLADEMQVFDKRTLLGVPARHSASSKTKSKAVPLRAKEVNTLRSSFR